MSGQVASRELRRASPLGPDDSHAVHHARHRELEPVGANARNRLGRRLRPDRLDDDALRSQRGSS